MRAAAKGNEPVSDSFKLEIGREVEKIFVAVNTSSFAALSVSAEHLATMATKYGLTGLPKRHWKSKKPLWKIAIRWRSLSWRRSCWSCAVPERVFKSTPRKGSRER